MTKALEAPQGVEPPDLNAWQAALIQLAERASDDAPTFAVSFVEDRYYEVTVGGLSARGYTSLEATARATLKLVALLKARSRGDADAVRDTSPSWVAMERFLVAAENGRQLLLPVDRAVLKE